MAETLPLAGYTNIHADCPGKRRPDLIRGMRADHRPNLVCQGGYRYVLMDVVFPGEMNFPDIASRWQLAAAKIGRLREPPSPVCAAAHHVDPGPLGRCEPHGRAPVGGWPGICCGGSPWPYAGQAWGPTPVGIGSGCAGNSGRRTLSPKGATMTHT